MSCQKQLSPLSQRHSQTAIFALQDMSIGLEMAHWFRPLSQT
jgi:hypothetical protein